jgi:hypothetical protein
MIKVLDRVIVDLRVARKRLIQWSIEDEEIESEQLEEVMSAVVSLHNMLKFAKGVKKSRIRRRPKQETLIPKEEPTNDGTEPERRKTRHNRDRTTADDAGRAGELG